MAAPVSSQRDAYLAARKDFEKSNEEVRKMGEFISKVGAYLANNPKIFSFSHVEVELPPGSTDYLREPFDAHEWKTAAEIQEKLTEMHEARLRMDQLWRDLADEDKNGVMPPVAI